MYKLTAFALLALFAVPSAPRAQAPLAPEADLDPENALLSTRTGTWDVVETVWATPGAEPTTTRFVAERAMVGAFLQETARPAPDHDGPDFRRIYYLGFHRGEGRWKYVSIDTRNPVGLMPASSFGPSADGRIELRFEPFAVPGADGTWQMLRMEETIRFEGDDREVAEERFIMADGSGDAWLAFRYEYTRRRAD